MQVCLNLYRVRYIIICPVAIAYSMGQIIKLVCVCQCVSVSVYLCIRLRALARSHLLTDFHQNWHRRMNTQKEKRVR